MLQSNRNWRNAISELVNFPKKLLPSEKMQCLLNTGKEIHKEAKRFYSKQLTGDDLLPIVIFVSVHASYRNGRIIITASDEVFVQNLISPQVLNGEGGYYFCVFSSAVQFIRNYDCKKFEERFSKIKRLRELGFV